MADDFELPGEVTSALQEHEETNTERLKALGISLAKKRGEAIAARAQSGIEAVWLAAEEAYLGIDATNRGGFSGAKWAKPTNLTGGLSKDGAVRGGEVESTAFFRMTSRYVDAGAAKLGEILLPADEKAFSFTSTPVPELVNKLKDTSQAILNGIPLERNAPSPGAAPTPGAPAVVPPTGVPPAAPGPPPGIPITVKDIAEEALETANKAATKAELRIYDWMVQSRYRAAGRTIIFDAARIGVGVLKGPFPRKEISRARSADKKGITILTKIVPAYERKDPWNIYPDPTCGENIQNGDHLFEKDPFSTKQLRRLKGQKGYITSAINKVLKEGPTGTAEGLKPGEKANPHRYILWHYHGTMGRDDMIAAGGLRDGETDAEEVYAVATMVNDTVIRATINPLDSGDIPYHSVPWQRRDGHWAGVGVAEQLAMPQQAINAALRAMFNNAGRSAGSIIVIDNGAITPADKSWILYPDKIFYKAADATADDVRKAFATFEIPNQTKWLMAIVELCLRLAEEVTNIPLVTQGQSGPTSPETFGATQIQNNNANQLLRSIGYAFDDYITEPVVNQSYEYLLLDEDVPEDEKGDWKINAHGSVALVERAIQDQTIQQMGQFVIQPAFGVDPKRWFAEFAKTKHLNPKNFQYTAEEQAKRDAVPPPPAPAVQVAQIKSADAEKALLAEARIVQLEGELAQANTAAVNATKEKVAAGRVEVDQLRVKKDTDRDTAFVNAEAARTEGEHVARMEELRLKRELALLDYANRKDLKLADVKKELAATEMKLAVQKELSGLSAAVDIRKHDTPDVQEVVPPVIKPAAEPTGVAPPGESFVK